MADEIRAADLPDPYEVLVAERNRRFRAMGIPTAKPSPYAEAAIRDDIAALEAAGLLLTDTGRAVLAAADTEEQK